MIGLTKDEVPTLNVQRLVVSFSISDRKQFFICVKYFNNELFPALR